MLSVTGVYIMKRHAHNHGAVRYNNVSSIMGGMIKKEVLLENSLEYGNMAMREFAADDRPRERLVQIGAEALRNAELLAILFRTGTREANAVALADRLLQHYDNDLMRLARASVEELQQIKGIGKVKAIEIRAALELGLRMVKSRGPARTRIQSSRDVVEFILPELRAYETESLVCLHLNTKNEVTKTVRISHGSMDSVGALPRDVFSRAMRDGAHGVIVVHNHPSGNPEPSQSDIMVTKRLMAAAELLGLRFLDHIIIGDGRHVSFQEHGLL